MQLTTTRNYSQLQASSGAEALQILEERNDFDVILCDLMMPGMTGIDLYEQVAAHTPELASRFLFMSGGVFGENMEERLVTIDRTIVSKPMDRKELRSVLSEFSEKR